MQTSYYNFKETLTSKPKLLTQEQINKVKLKDNTDYYVSIFKYSEAQKKRIEETGSVAGITDVTTSNLVWDFDDKANPDLARQDAVTLATRLVSAYGVDPDIIQCAYSGYKGFHLTLPIDKEISPDAFKKATGELAKDLKTYDLSVNDPARILRVYNTKNPKTGLYKIPLKIYEVTK